MASPSFTALTRCITVCLVLLFVLLPLFAELVTASVKESDNLPYSPLKIYAFPLESFFLPILQLLTTNHVQEFHVDQENRGDIFDSNNLKFFSCNLPPGTMCEYHILNEDSLLIEMSNSLGKDMLLDLPLVAVLLSADNKDVSCIGHPERVLLRNHEVVTITFQCPQKIVNGSGIFDLRVTYTFVGSTIKHTLEGTAILSKELPENFLDSQSNELFFMVGDRKIPADWDMEKASIVIDGYEIFCNSEEKFFADMHKIRNLGYNRGVVCKVFNFDCPGSDVWNEVKQYVYDHPKADLSLISTPSSTDGFVVYPTSSDFSSLRWEESASLERYNGDFFPCNQQNLRDVSYRMYYTFFKKGYSEFEASPAAVHPQKQKADHTYPAQNVDFVASVAEYIPVTASTSSRQRTTASPMDLASTENDPPTVTVQDIQNFVDTSGLKDALPSDTRIAFSFYNEKKQTIPGTEFSIVGNKVQQGIVSNYDVYTKTGIYYVTEFKESGDTCAVARKIKSNWDMVNSRNISIPAAAWKYRFLTPFATRCGVL